MEPIYYVENDENDVFLLRRAFRKIGLPEAVRHFFTGDTFKEALEGQHVPSLFLLDLKLDAESGLDLLRWIKEQDRFSDIPVIIFSSGTVPAEMMETMTLNATAYMFKPTSADTWRDVAEQLAVAAGLKPPLPAP